MSAALRRGLKLLPHLRWSRSVASCSTLACPSKRPRTMVSTIQYSARKLRTTPMRPAAIVPFKLSDIGEGIAEVTIKEWYVEVGDEVAQFDNICEVQSDKATVTITSRYEGLVKAIHFETDETCKVGQALVDIEVSDEEAENVKPTESPAPAPVPDVAPPTPAPPPVYAAPPTPPSPPPPSSSPPPPPPPPPPTLKKKSEILTTPAVRKMAADQKVDLSAVPATGKGGRITKDDLLAYIAAGSPPPAPPAPEPTVATIPTAHMWNTSPTSHYAGDTPTLPGSPSHTQDKTVEIKGIAKVMVNTMNAAQKVPRFTYHDEYPVDGLIRLKKLMKDIGKEHKVKLTFMPLIIKAASQALMEFPMVNAHVNEDCTAITYKASHNIGIATDTPHGLMVPNIKNVQNLSILDIASELHRLKTLSENNKLSMDDVTGGTFSLSNVGAVGGTYASPMLVVPEVCIGALGKIQTRPAFNDEGEVHAANTMCVSWSGDHRVLDGATVARYSNTLRRYLENPSSLLFHLK